jgi:class 3 adenylate cyclase
MDGNTPQLDTLLEDLFDPRCGIAIQIAQRKERSARMPEERKLVTVLFADVTGSTSLGEALDPEDMRTLMGCHAAG